MEISSRYLPGARGAGTAMVIARASVRTRRAATLVGLVGSRLLGTGATGMGGTRGPATTSESSAIFLQVATKPTPAGMAPPVHVRRTEAWLWPLSGPSTAGAANLIER